MNTNIFIVSEFVDDETNSTGYYWNGIIKGLSKKIKSISVISTRESLSKCVFDENIQIQEIDSKFSNNKFNFIKPIRNLLSSVALATRLFKLIKKNDIVFFGTNPIFLMPIIVLVCAICKAKTIYLIHDLFPENIISISNKKKFLYYILIAPVFKYVRKKINCLICIGKDMEKILLEQKNNNQIIKFIPNWIVDPDKKNYANLNKNTKTFVFQYFGNIGQFQDVKKIISAIALINQKEIVFEFIGSGSQLQKLKDMSFSHNIKNITFIDQVPFKKRQEIFEHADVSLVTLSEKMIGYAVPSKAYMSISAARKILYVGKTETELGYLLQENPSLGWTHENNDPESLANKFKEIYLDKNNNLYNIKPSKHIIFESHAIDEYYKLIQHISEV